MSSITVLALCGSLRQESFNKKLMQQAIQLAPKELEFSLGNLSKIPLYNEDTKNAGFPDCVDRLNQLLIEADATLIVTPEYNYSIPGVLKNAIDWLSRYQPQGFYNKPVAIMGASPGRMGTCRCQYHLRQVMVFLNAWVLNMPEIMVSDASRAFDHQGRLNDPKLVELVQKQMHGLKRMVQD
ncbi:NADPH-dependent FMN reductase [Microbulbifer spongiae]|uniref:NAD(P)H-dependent oxidoreductase n=1 Tax=Microbulbifer spongiae TaxID=2944933 RepID=A0ABY9EIC4_9GAMM|nr:NAD(P)H-dependent oxidoreductase [Microbulbifer sp. MI-G]WKD51410.1 NAD(P)H-dependent oxidoreductase [Microbulbifer sp. MI-G]